MNRLMALLAAVALALSMAARPAAEAPALDDVLKRAARDGSSLERELASIKAEEQYTQVLQKPGFADLSRRLRSDLLLLKPSPRREWMQYRDVFEVDDVPVRDRDERLARLFNDRPAS